jgi:hypothetical protein
MNEPINHHYLPVFYLRQWAGSDGRVIRFYRPYDKVVASPIAPSNTGYEPLLYSLDGYPPEVRQRIEKEYMGPLVDGPAADAMRVLIERDEAKLTGAVRSAWTRFLMATRVRSPEMIGLMMEQGRTNLVASLNANPEEYEAVRPAGSPPTFLAWVEKHAAPLLHNIGKLMLPNVIENQNIGDTIIRMKWSTFDLSSACYTLLTSDRPFVMTHGLADPRCVIAFPLGPRFAFVALHDTRLLDHLLSQGVDGFVKSLNANVVDQAVRHVYGSTDAHLRFVQNRFRTTPRPLVLGR